MAAKEMVGWHSISSVSSILTLKQMNQTPKSQDRVDSITHEWNESWPELSTDAFGVIGRVLLIGHHLYANGAEVLREYDLQSGEFDVLATLRRTGAPFALSMSELSRDVMLTSGGMTHRVDRLVQRGLVSREHDTRDRRSVRVRLTRQGRQVAEAALVSKVAQANADISVLSAREVETLKELLRKLLVQFECRSGGSN